MNKRLRLNTIMGAINQIIVLVCGLILPKAILNCYGSETNGLVNSISSILNVIALLEFGVGAVVQSTLYKPLAENDVEKISKIYATAKRFFRIVGTVFLLYVIGVSIVYPIYQIKNFEFLFTFVLILALSVSFFAEYYFGLVNSLLLFADQKNYIIYFIRSVTVIVNVIVSLILIHFKIQIQIVYIATAAIFLTRPIIYTIYTKKHYNLIKTKADQTALPQKWDGLAQHIAAFVLDNTDIIVLTIFGTLFDVSIYTVYYLVAKSLRNLIVSLTGGIQPYYGRLIAVNDYDKLKNDFNKYTFLITGLSVLCYSIAIMSIVPFVLVYTKGVTDTNYSQLAFGILLLISQLVYTFRYSLNIVIMAAGRYKETKISAIIEAVLNIIVSVVLVIFFGLIGVAIGTLVAMFFRMVYFTIFISKDIIKKSYLLIIKQLILATPILILAILLSIYKPFVVDNYWEWMKYTSLYALIILGCFIVINCIFNFKYLKQIVQKVCNRKRA